MAKLSNETLSGLTSGITTENVSNTPWADSTMKSIHGQTTGPKMVQLFTKEAEADANLSTGLDSDDDWQYDDKRDKGNFPITHAVRVDDNNLYFRSEGVSNIPVGQLEFNGLGIIGDGSVNTSTTRWNEGDFLTSNTSSPNYQVSASSEFDASYRAFEAFDNDVPNAWSTVGGAFSGGVGNSWLEVTLTEALIFNKYMIEMAGTNNADVWVIEAKLEVADDWVELDSVTGGAFVGIAYHTFTNTTPYKHYRIRVTQLDTSGTILSFDQLSFIEATPPQNVQVGSIDAGGIELLTSILSLSGSTQGQALNDIMTAINNGPTDVTATQNPDYPERIKLTGTDATFSDAPITVTTQAVDLTKLTDFTSYDDGSVVVLGPESLVIEKLDLSTGVTYFHSSSEVAGYEAEKAFNGVLTLPDYWQIPAGAGHVGVDLGVGKGRTVVRYRLSSTGSNTMPDVFTFEGKQVADGPWTVLDSVSYTPVENELSEYFLIDSPANYEMYRINVTATTGNAINVTRIIELEMDATYVSQVEDTLGIFTGAQIVDTFDNTYHITDITTVEGVSGSDKSQITVLETLPIDAEWEVKRIANAETYKTSGVAEFDPPTSRVAASFGSGTFASGSINISNLGATSQNAISTEDYALTIGTSVKFAFNSAVNFDGMGFIKSDIAVNGFDRTDTGIGSFAIFLDAGSATSPAYAYVDGGQVAVDASNHGSGTFYIEYVGDGNFDFYKNDTTFLGQVSTTLQDGDRVKLTAQSGMISTSCEVYLTDWEEPVLSDGGFRLLKQQLEEQHPFSSDLFSAATEGPNVNRLLSSPVTRTITIDRVFTKTGANPTVNVYTFTNIVGSVGDVTFLKTAVLVGSNGDTHEIQLDSPITLLEGEGLALSSVTGGIYHESSVGISNTLLVANFTTDGSYTLELGGNTRRAVTYGEVIPPDQNHFHTLAPNGQDAILTKPSTSAQVTNFGFRLPDNSASSVEMYGEEGYMAFATEFNLDMTPKNCVIYNKTLEQREVIATSIASDRGGIGEDGEWWYRSETTEYFNDSDPKPGPHDVSETAEFNVGAYQTNATTPYVIDALTTRGSGGDEPYIAFNGSEGDSYRTSGSAPGWLEIDLGVDNEKVFSKYRLRGGPSADHTPDDFTIEGSFDGDNWDVLDTQTSASAVAFTGLDVDIPEGLQDRYRFYRIAWTSLGGAVSDGGFNELKFYEPIGYVTTFDSRPQGGTIDPALLVVKDEVDAAYNLSTAGAFNIEVNVDGAGFDNPRDISFFILEDDIVFSNSIQFKIIPVDLADLVGDITISIKGKVWSPSKDQARVYAEALEMDADNRNPATYFTYQHPSILTQEQWGKLFFGTDKFAPFIGVRSTTGGAPSFTNIWTQFSSILRDIKLGTGSVTVEPIIGSTEIQLTNVSGDSIDGQVVAYVLG